MHQVKRSIERADELLARSDLTPTFPHRFGQRAGYAPPVYHGPGEPLLTFDTDQGWEVVTPHGRIVEEAVREVGAGIDRLAVAERRTCPPFSLPLLEQQSDRLAARIADIQGTPCRRDALAAGLKLCPRPAPEYRDREDYRHHVERTQRHVTRRIGIASGPGSLIAEEDDKYKWVEPSLTCELDKLTRNDPSNAWQMYQATLDSRTRLHVLAQIREFGGHYPDGFIVGQLSRDRLWSRREEARTHLVEAAMRAVASTATSLPRDWVECMPGRLRVGYTEDRPEFGMYSYWKRTSGKWWDRDATPNMRLGRMVDNGPMTGWESNALHEMGHHLEYVFPEINQIARAHKALRSEVQGKPGSLLPLRPLFTQVIAGPDPRSLSDLQRGPAAGTSWGEALDVRDRVRESRDAHLQQRGVLHGTRGCPRGPVRRIERAR